jgi:nickel/cobalt exporter
MTNLNEMIQSGTAHVWLYIPTAILLGALHGLEPGHSKTMMAAFIIAIRGTIWQAILLGLSAAISHSLIIWVLAALALHYGNQWNAEQVEPYLQLMSGALIFCLAVWMYFRTRREVQEAEAHGGGHSHSHEGHSHNHDDDHDHDHGDHHHEHSHSHDHGHTHSHESVSPSGLILPAGFVAAPASTPTTGRGPNGGMLMDTGHGWLEIAVAETNMPPRFRIHPCRANGAPVPMPKGTVLSIETARLDGSVQKFTFEAKDKFWEATAILPEPHEFLATVTMGHGDHAHTYKLRFTEAHDHSHAPVGEVIKEEGDVYQDAHERAHAEDIARRFAGRSVTTPQIVLFGITGGLMPCPAAFTILLVCLQLKKATLGFAIVGAFSFGLALTMVTVGAVAAWSVQHAQRKFSGFGDAMRRAPYVSCVLLMALAVFMAWQGWHGIANGHH